MEITSTTKEGLHGYEYNLFKTSRCSSLLLRCVIEKNYTCCVLMTSMWD